MSGKGSRPRPIKDRKQFSDNWDQIFGNKKSQTQQENIPTPEEIEEKKEQAQDPRNG